MNLHERRPEDEGIFDYTFSRSQLADYVRCSKKYEYGNVRLIEDTSPGSIPMRYGTIGHYGIAHGYEALKQLQSMTSAIGIGPESIKTLFANEAKAAMAALIERGMYYYRGEPQELRINPDDHADVIDSLNDVIDFYTEHNAWADYQRYKVVSTETQYGWNVTIDLPGEAPVVVEMSGVIDACMEDTSYRGKRILSIMDHKFVGDVNLALAFLPLDVQMLMYEVIMDYYAREIMGYDKVEMVYNMIRREVPPGFGHRSEKTKSGAKSTASRKVEDYLRRDSLQRSDNQLRQIESNFLRPTLKKMVLSHRGMLDFTISPVKTGGESCTGCPYFARCKAELVGAGGVRFGHPAE